MKTDIKKSAVLSVLIMVLFLFGCSNKADSSDESSSVIDETSSVVENSSEIDELSFVVDSSSEIDDSSLAESEIDDAFSELSEWHIMMFKDISTIGVEDVKNGNMTLAALDDTHNQIIDSLVIEGTLPANGISLFNQWKQQNGYYDQFTKEQVESLIGNNNSNENTGNSNAGGNISSGPANKPTTPNNNGGNIGASDDGTDIKNGCTVPQDVLDSFSGDGRPYSGGGDWTYADGIPQK